jgi:hypothetical protein
VGDFRASQPARQECAKAQPIADGYGLNTSESFASLDRDGLWERTSPDSFLPMMEDCLGEFSGTWPKAGTMQNGRCFLRPLLTPITLETDYVWLPTPQASDGKSYYVVTWSHAKKRLNGENGTQVHLPHILVLSLGWDKCFVNPLLYEHLMGFPRRWTDLGA